MAQQFDLTGNNAIDQGSVFSFSILYPGNVAANTFKSQIRKTFKGDLIADFTIAATYNSGTNKTTILLSLDSNQTANLPATRGINYWVYDVEMTPIATPLGTIRLVQGDVEITAEVTLNV